MMQQYEFRQLRVLERAARAAVGCWFAIEQRLCEAVQNAKGPNEVIPDGWFGYWGVGRTFRRDGNRDAVRHLLFRSRPELMAAQPSRVAWEFVQLLAQEIEPMNAGCRPTSLVSKFAFSCAPMVFAPYDRIARGQLRTQDHDYLAYSQAFERNRTVIQRELATLVCSDGNVGLFAQNLPVDGNSMNEQLFFARAADWFLLLQGGYDATSWPVHYAPIVRNTACKTTADV